jgi:hypothetical protein
MGDTVILCYFSLVMVYLMIMSLNQTASNDGMISQSWIGKYEEGSGLDLIQHVVLACLDSLQAWKFHHKLNAYVTALSWELEFNSVKQYSVL